MVKINKILEYEQACEYEVTSRVWLSYIKWNWLQQKVAKYYAKKTAKKYNKYLAFKTRQIERLQNKLTKTK